MPATRFLVRVEPLAGPPSGAAQSALVSALAREGFKAWVAEPGGAEYLLPAGTYHLVATATPLEVLGRVQRVVAAAGMRCAVVVAEVAVLDWLGLDRVPDGVPYD